MNEKVGPLRGKAGGREMRKLQSKMKETVQRETAKNFNTVYF